MQCLICQSVINLEDIYHNSEKCPSCLNMFHTNCTIRLVRNQQNKAKCPCCRQDYNPVPLSKLERLLLKSDKKLYKCLICGCIRQRDHVYWCICDGALNERERWKRETTLSLTKDLQNAL